MYFLRSKNRELIMHEPIVMGIINLTNDSFWENSRFTLQNAIKAANEMLEQGATIIDIGAQSTKPGANLKSVEHELEQLIPFITNFKKTNPNCWVSVDTFQSAVADNCLQAGADIINDVYAGTFDNNMHAIVAKWQVPYVLMHMQGNPKTMQQNPQYQNVTAQVMAFFLKHILKAKKAGVIDIIVDPGFGFGKNLTHNFELIRNFSFFKQLQVPLLAGISRKSLIYKTLNTEPANAINGTTFLHARLLSQGANILRVHDVLQAMECIQLHTKLNTII